MERIKDIIDRYTVFVWWILMCIMMLGAMTGCIIAMKKCVFVCSCGLIGSVLAFLIFAWEAWGEWLEARQIK